MSKILMMIMGHAAFAYLLVKSMFMITKKKLDSRRILFVVIFANILDLTHVSIFRAILHNMLGTLVFSVFLLFFFERAKLIEKKDFPILLFAVATHVLLDLFIVPYPLFPLKISLFLKSPIPLFIIEPFLVILSFLVFFLSGDYSQFKIFLYKEKEKFMESFTIQTSYNCSFFLLYLFILFYLFAIAQFYHICSWLRDGYALSARVSWETFLFSVIYVLSLSLLATLTFKRKKDSFMFLLSIYSLGIIQLFFPPMPDTEVWFATVFLFTFVSFVCMLFVTFWERQVFTRSKTVSSII